MIPWLLIGLTSLTVIVVLVLRARATDSHAYRCSVSDEIAQ
jgi:hypothetical protein